MKKAIAIIILMLLPTAAAYKVKYNHPGINQTMMQEYFNQQNLTGIKLIRVYHCVSNVFSGWYFISGIIHIDDCYGYKWIIQHELKHHYCWKSERYLGHEGCFNG